MGRKSDISLFGEGVDKSKDLMGNTGKAIIGVGAVIGAGVLLGLGIGAVTD